MRFARRSSDSCCIMHLNLAIHLIALAIWVRSHYYVAIEFGDFTITPKTTSEKSMKSISKNDRFSDGRKRNFMDRTGW